MGANQPKDIEKLCKIADPNHGLITNIAPAHLEGFGDIESVAKTKGELFQSGVNCLGVSNETELAELLTNEISDEDYQANNLKKVVGDYPPRDFVA